MHVSLDSRSFSGKIFLWLKSCGCVWTGLWTGSLDLTAGDLHKLPLKTLNGSAALDLLVLNRVQRNVCVH